MKGRISLLLLIQCACLLAQAQLHAPKTSYNLGEVSWHSTKTQAVELQNKTRQPLTLTAVLTDCGCTTAEWQQGQVVAPGQKATVCLNFNAELLGHFRKAARIYTQGAKGEGMTEVWLEGVVVSALTDYSVEYPYNVGEGVYLTTGTVEFDDVADGGRPQQTIGIANGTKKPYTPTLMHLPKWLTATCQPSTLRAGQTGTLTLTADAAQVGRYGLTQTSIYVSRHLGDHVGKDNDVQVSLTLVPHADTSPAALAAAPRAQLDSVVVLQRKNNKKNAKQTGEVVLTNTGASTLEVNRLQVYNAGLRVSLNQSSIKPGETAILSVSRQGGDSQVKGRQRILLITNDPRRPKITIDVKVPEALP